MSDTPRTDALVVTVELETPFPLGEQKPFPAVHADFARTLERELAAATQPVGEEEVAKAIEFLHDYPRGVTDGHSLLRLCADAAALLTRLVREINTAKEMYAQSLQIISTEMARAEAAERELAFEREAHEAFKTQIEAQLKARDENAEHLRMQIGYIVTELMLKGDTRTLPEIVEAAAKATAHLSDAARREQQR